MEKPTPRKARNFLESLHFATAGVLYAFRTQRNVRTHFAMGGLVLLFALHLPLSRAELALLLLTIGFVVAAELMNTAVELVVDLLSERYHRLAQLAKDVAAGTVLVAAVTAVFVGYVLFFDRLSSLHPGLLQRTASFPPTMVLLALVLVSIVVVALKALHPQFRLRGGMPSFHAALAGALATAVFLLARDGMVVVLTFILAGLVAQSRVEGGIHSPWEVLVGGFLGALIMLLVFQSLS